MRHRLLLQQSLDIDRVQGRSARFEPGVDGVEKLQFIDDGDRVVAGLDIVTHTADEIGLGFIIAGVAAAQDYHAVFSDALGGCVVYLFVNRGGYAATEHRQAGAEQQCANAGSHGVSVAVGTSFSRSQCAMAGTRLKFAAKLAPASRSAMTAARFTASWSLCRKAVGVLP